jgi:hypothetical protein
MIGPGNALYQNLTFTSSSSSLSLYVSNIYNSRACTLAFSIETYSISSLTITITNSESVVVVTQTLNNLSNSQFQNITIPFTAPGLGDNFIIKLNNAVGTLCLTRGWALFAGTSVNTQIRGNLSVPFGIISSTDFMYNGNYLTSTLTTLSTAPAPTAASIGLGNVANTAPSDLPISTATQNALKFASSVKQP